MNLLLVGLLAAGCAPSVAPKPTRPQAPVAVPRPQAGPEPEKEAEAPPPPPPVIEVKAAALVPLLTPRLGDRYARQLAELLDGAIVTDIELSADGRARGVLVHRQKKPLYVALGTPMRVGATPAGAANKQAAVLTGQPASVTTLEALAAWLRDNPGALHSLRAGSVPLTLDLGIYRVAEKPTRVSCKAGPSHRPGVVLLDLTVEYLGHATEFRAVRRPDGKLALTSIDRVDGEDWAVYAARHLAKGGGR
jgi:hypothetical protein